MKITILTVIFPVLFQLFYIRYVSYNVDKSLFGDFVILSTLIYAISQLLLSIPGQAFSRFYNGTKDKLLFINEFRTYLIVVNTFSLLFIFFMYLFYKDRFSIEIYILTYVLFVLLNNYSLNQKIFLLELKRSKFFIFKILEALSKFIFPLIMYYYYNTLESFILGIVIGYLISFIILTYSLREIKFKLYLNLANQKKYFLFAYPILLAAFFSWMITFSDRYFIDYFLNAEQVAIYAILAQFGAMAQVLGTVYGYYVNPIVLKKYEVDNNETMDLLFKYIKMFILILIALFVVFLLIPLKLFYIIIDPNIINDEYYYHVLVVLFLSTILATIQTAFSMVYTLNKKLLEYAKIFFLCALLNLVLNFFVKDFGIIAAAYSTLGAYLLFNVILFLRLRKLL